MEYVQERIATLHDLEGGGLDIGSGSGSGSDSTPPSRSDESANAVGAAPERVGEAAVVVPMTDREYEHPAAARVLSELESVDPAAVYLPIRSSPDRLEPFREWLESYDLPTQVLWCDAPGVDALLTEVGLAGSHGKGRDVWLALGPAAAAGEYVVVHDADARSYEVEHVHRLLAPLTMEPGYDFVKGYYARVERGRLYGRLCRLFYEPLIETLAASHDAAILSYLGAFRYALAGEFAATADLVQQLRVPRSWGLEVGTLGDAFDHAGFSGTAQVDLGRHVHDHRQVAGESGLEGMSHEVAAELLQVIEARGVEPDYETLPDRFRETGERLIAQYRADAAFNGLDYDVADERDQLERYAAAIEPPGRTATTGDGEGSRPGGRMRQERLPPWTDAPIDPEGVLEAAQPWRDERLETRTQD